MDEGEAERKLTKERLDMLKKIDDFPYFVCDNCGRGPYRFCHYVTTPDGRRLKYCRYCWEHSVY